MGPRLTHKRAAGQAAQQVFIMFGGEADQPWLWPLRRGFRHCFAALRDATGWSVLDPLSGRLVVCRLDLPAGFDLPGFYARAGLTVTGPFSPAEPRRSWWPPLLPYNCVAVCRAALGPAAPFAVTPYGLFRSLHKNAENRKIVLTNTSRPA